MQRKTQKEAFKMEREREQYRHGSFRSQSDSPNRSFESSRATSPSEPLRAGFLKPKQRVTYLSKMRKGLVQSTKKSETERPRSMSPAISISSKSSTTAPRSRSEGYSLNTSTYSSSSHPTQKTTQATVSSSSHTHHPGDISSILSRYEYTPTDPSASFISDNLDTISLGSSLDDDSYQLLTDYQSARGQTQAEIKRAKESLSKRPPISKPAKRTPAFQNISTFDDSFDLDSSRPTNMDQTGYSRYGQPPRMIDREIAKMRQTHHNTWSRPGRSELTSEASLRIGLPRPDPVPRERVIPSMYDVDSSSFSDHDLLMMSGRRQYSRAPQDTLSVSELTRMREETISARMERTRPVNATDIKTQISRDRLRTPRSSQRP